MQNTNLKPLNVAIVGAGLGGLAAAIAFRRNGHHVRIFEADELKAEVAAGLSVPVNAQRVLENLGYSKANLKGVNYEGTVQLDANGGEGKVDRWLMPELNQNLLVHRTDLHDELRRLALGPGEGPPATLHLSSRVVECDTEKAVLKLANGNTIETDVIIGADGISTSTADQFSQPQSTMRTSILGHEQRAQDMSPYRFRSIVDTTKLDKNADLAWLSDGIDGPRVIASSGTPPRMMIVYPCRNGTLLNIGGPCGEEHENDRGPVPREVIQGLFADFDPKFKQLIDALDESVHKWRMRTVPVLPTWVRGHAALLGDAAHAMLPTLGQGAAMGFEEAGTLGVLFPLGTTREQVPARLAAYEALRKPRADYIATESTEQIINPAKRGAMMKSKSFQEDLFGYDAIKAAEEYYRQFVAVTGAN
ncbi:hypothetical protein B0H13DRAFT_2556265 [Mycena leptocephala]|nr:hypothetical protein B0H13DRAFT_2556265 [Mycena leptocephala]